LKKTLAVVLLLLPFSFSAAEEIHLISVNGVAEKSIEPNMLIVRMESWAKASSAKKAQDIQAAQFAKVKTQLEKYKIKKEDVQTDSYNVSPEYVYDQKTQTNKITGYRVNHSFSVIYRTIANAGEFLDQVVTGASDVSGVNVSGVNWDSDRKSEAELSALGDAVKAARDRANELAKAAGVTIKATHKIQNSSNATPVPRPMFERSAGLMMKSESVPTELSEGQIKVRVDVQMEFEI
jgi:uncharacterized protein YggE